MVTVTGVQQFLHAFWVQAWLCIGTLLHSCYPEAELHALFLLHAYKTKCMHDMQLVQQVEYLVQRCTSRIILFPSHSNLQGNQGQLPADRMLRCFRI